MENPAKLREYLERVTLDLRKAHRRIEDLEQQGGEPIAIVGMACRYPGGVTSPEGLWRLVSEGRDGISEFPADRGWDLGRLYDPDREAGAERFTSYGREGGFVHDSPDFDADFFGISPREALSTDPQQRQLLEASWEALEFAGIDPRSLAGSRTGVFAGVMYQDYGEAPGMSQSLVSGRVAYTLGLEGPAVTVDTACSSSLVAMHWAAQALRSGECSLALAGGVTVLGTPTVFVEFSRQRGLAPDGRSKSFADAADGVGWSEGVGVLALMRLSEAERDGYRVLATIKGSAVNQDGASNGFSAPNGPSQERVIRQALLDAGLEPAAVDAVDGHGTGTTLGDPIEAGALLATYGQGREEPLRLGSIKSNIGHAQAAAGVAGVIKMVEAMRHGVLPRTLHVDAPSSKVDWESGEVELLTEETEWRPNGRPRRAGISSFGVSGTNAHVILEEAPEASAVEGGEEAEVPQPPLPGTIALPLSAKSEPALREAAANLSTRLAENPELDLGDVAHSLATTRALFERRAVVVGEEREEIIERLVGLSKGDESPDLFEDEAKSGKLAYLLTGQGAQRPGMGRELYESSPAFAQALDQACATLDQHLERPLKDLLFAKEGSKKAGLLDQTTYTQPALFAIELALYRLTEQLGLKPDYLTGHSIGELTAAHISGVFSLEDAAKLICARARLMGELPEGGAMVAIEATEAEVEEAIEGKEQELSIAAVNGPTAIVISGEEQAALEVQSQFEEQGHKTKRLTVSHAFHSPLIEPMLDDFEEVAKSIDYAEPRIPIVSNTTGEILSAEQATDPTYWVSHVRQAVRFRDGIETLHEQGATAFIELGPDPVLTAMAASCFAEAESQPQLISTLRFGRPEAQALTGALAKAHVAGAKLDWTKLHPGAKRVPLPTYPFQRERFWVSASAGLTDASSIGQREIEHPLLAAAIEDPEGERLTLTGRISLATYPWLADHAVLGTTILPGTAFVELALRAAEETGMESIAELTLQAPLALAEQGAVSLQLTVGPEQQGSRSITIHSRSEGEEDEAGEWVLHASGSLSAEAAPAPEPFGAWPPEGAEPLEVEGAYERLAEIGFAYGPAFQGLTAAWQAGEEIYAEVSLPEEQHPEARRFVIHPALLDAAFHAGLDGALAESEDASPVLPFDWNGVRVFEPGASVIRVRVSMQENRLELLAFDQSGVPVAEIETLVGRPVEASQLKGAGKRDLFRLEWKETPLPDAEDGGTPETEDPQSTLLDTRDWSGDEDPIEASHAIAAKALEAIQAHLAQEETQARLVFLTEGALSAEGEGSDLPAATLAGLLRSAVSEHPGRFALIDTDASDASEEALQAAIAASAEEPQIALREGNALVPRLAEAREGGESEAPSFDPGKTVLITGATGGLGALFAKHLAQVHGARHLLLLSRSGTEAEGAQELLAELEALGASATIAACDVSDREQLQELLVSIPVEHPLGAVIHCAGVFDNALLADLDPERLDRVIRPKADAAWNLHELSADKELSHFLLFSSAAGLLGGPGQGNYAAANSFLDALALKRKQRGLPATSLAWGLWAQESNLAAGMDEAQLAQVLRQTRMLLGFSPMSQEQGLDLFEQALSQPDSLLAPVHFDRAALRAQAKAGSLPALMRGMVRVPVGRERSGDSLATRLATVPEGDREAFVLDFVRGHVAAVLGHDSAAAVAPERAFKELGFDSLAAVELRNRLVAATGVPLSAATAFDYPSASALAQHLMQRVGPAEGNGVVLDPEEHEIRRAIASIPLPRLRQSGLMDQLMRLANIAEETAIEEEDEDDLIDSMDVEELVRRSTAGVSEGGEGQ